MTKRITASLSEEAYEQLRVRAFGARMSISRTAGTIIELGLSESGRAGRDGLPQSREEPRRDDMTAPSEQMAALPLPEHHFKGPDFKR